MADTKTALATSQAVQVLETDMARIGKQIDKVYTLNAASNLDLTHDKNDAINRSPVGKAKTAFALAVSIDDVCFDVAGTDSASNLVKMIRSQVVKELGADIADMVLEPRSEDQPNKLTTTERTISRMLNGGGMTTSIGALQIAATFIGYTPAR